jgi:hypothetical protein
MKTLKDILLERLVLSKTKSSIEHAVICTEEEILNDELYVEEIDKFNQPFILTQLANNTEREYTYFYLFLNDNIIGIIEYNNYYAWLNLIVPLKTYKNLTGLYDYPQNDDYIELDTNIKRCILMLDERFENKQLIGLTIPEIFVRDKNQYWDKSSLTSEYVKLLEYIKTILE